MTLSDLSKTYLFWGFMFFTFIAGLVVVNVWPDNDGGYKKACVETGGSLLPVNINGVKWMCIHGTVDSVRPLEK